MRKPFYIILAVIVGIIVVVILSQPPDATCHRSCAVSTDPDRCVSLCMGQ